MYILPTLVVCFACAVTSLAGILPKKSTDPGQTFTVVSTTNSKLNGKPVNIYFDNTTSNPDDYDVVTKLGSPLVYQLRNGILFSQQQVIKTGDYKDTGLIGGLEIFQPPLELFQFRNQSTLVKGSSFQNSIKNWYLQQVGVTGSTYDLLATTTRRNHGFYACLTPDKPPTKIAVPATSAQKSHYLIIYSSGGGTPPSSCSKVKIQTTLVA